ncbi:MAG: ATP-binding protein [SAR324 cluster bacterium]|nr:ATP-binding protein [SAR324 cluster bacterium]
MALTVDIHSFSYHLSQIPEDPTGHGGGFVFDCRGLPNPGREAIYRTMSGLDAPVQDYFLNFPEVARFSEAVAVLVLQTLQTYQERNFAHLMVSFGCTGGQHRSVYQADMLRMRLFQEGRYLVEISHQEQFRWLKQN